MSREAQIRKITWIGLVANILLSACKFAAGYFGRSQAVIADAVHSLSDTVTDVAVIAGSHYWGRPPDETHPYGHRRVETLVAVFIGVMLAAAGAAIGWDAIATLHRHHESRPAWVAVGVACLSIVSKEILYRWTAACGKKIKSPALAANAWHHRSDAISSIPVVVAVAGAILFPSWSFLDHVGAAVVSLFIIQAGLSILWPGLRELIDSGAPETVRREIARIACDHSGVIQVHDIRTRFISASIQVDLHIVVDGDLSVREGHAIAKEVEQRLVDRVPEIIDVVVHVDPPENAK